MSTLDLSEYIRVVNRTESKIRGRFDGKDYEFKVNDPTDVHQSVAAHIFGFGVEDKTNAFRPLPKSAVVPRSAAQPPWLMLMRMTGTGFRPRPRLMLRTWRTL